MKKIRILLVEDEVLIAQCLMMELEQSGYEVCSFVSSGMEAVAEFKAKNPDLVLMDVNLPGEMDGIDAAEEIASIKCVPIIFMTGYNKTNILDRVQKIPSAVFLEKPIEIYDLQPVIDSLMKQ